MRGGWIRFWLHENLLGFAVPTDCLGQIHDLGVVTGFLANDEPHPRLPARCPLLLDLLLRHGPRSRGESTILDEGGRCLNTYRSWLRGTARARLEPREDLVCIIERVALVVRVEPRQRAVTDCGGMT